MAVRVFLAVISVILALASLSGFPAQASLKDGYLLCTQWDQVNDYAKFCPGNNRAGCWATALAQILYFHKVQPTGAVDYITTAGFAISEKLDAFQFNWDLFVEKLDDRTSEQSKEQVAKYIYFASVVTQKDFGTGNSLTVINEYKDGRFNWNIDQVIRNLTRHFSCTAKGYHYDKRELESNKEDIERLIQYEIDSRRPIMLYIQSGNTGHATVIDGYSNADGRFIVHINQGLGGYANKWYDFNKPIMADLDDMNHRMLITIKPNANNDRYAKESFGDTDYLLKTQWDRQGSYAKFCSDGQPIGDWAAALAQILAYHEYQPKGKIRYTTSSGIAISETLDSDTFDWNRFAERLDAKASTQSVEQVAKYIYDTEIVLEKNFGSAGYNTIIVDDCTIDVSRAIRNLERHFACKAKAHLYVGAGIKSSLDTITRLLQTQITDKCPLLLFYKPHSRDGACAVIDGFVEENDEAYIHINAGQDGAGNQWYRLSALYDMDYLLLLTVQ